MTGVPLRRAVTDKTRISRLAYARVRVLVQNPAPKTLGPRLYTQRLQPRPSDWRNANADPDHPDGCGARALRMQRQSGGQRFVALPLRYRRGLQSLRSH